MEMLICLLLKGLIYFATNFYLAASKANPSDESKLVQKLFANYKKSMRPALTATAPVKVSFDLSLRQVMDFDEKNQVVTWNVWARQMWQDFRLQWNQSEFAVDWLVLNPMTIWVPDIYLYNNAQENYRGFDFDIEDGVFVRPSGTVHWSTRLILRSTCIFSAKYFPFDEQNCPLQFGSWSYTGNHLNLTLARSHGDLSMASANGEWHVVDFKAVRNVVYYSCCPEPYPSVTYTLQVRRRSMFYIYSFMVPSLVITLLSVLAFFLPHRYGERVNLLITCLLSLTVYSLMISDMTPENPEGTPLFSKFMIAILAEISIAIMLICLIIDVEGKSSLPPKFVRLFLNKGLGWLFGLSPGFRRSRKVEDAGTKDAMKYKQEDHPVVIENQFTEETKQTEFTHDNPLDILSYNEETEEDIQDTAKTFPTLSSKFKDEFLVLLKDMSSQLKDEIRSDSITNERQQLAWVIDKFLHLAFALVVVMTLGAVLIIPPEVHL